MNGIYLHLWLDETGDKLIGRRIEDVRLKDRLVQFVFGENALYVSLFPEAPAVFFAPVQKKDFEKDARLSAELTGCRVMTVDQAHHMPVLHIVVLKTDIDAVDKKTLTVMLYREAPNIVVQHGQKLKKLYPKHTEKNPKKKLTELSEHDLVTLRTREQNDLASYLVKEIEGVDRFLAQELTPCRLTELRQILAGAPVRPRLVSFLPLRVSLFAEDYLHAQQSFNTLYRKGIEGFLEARAAAVAEAQKRDAVRKIKKRIMRLRKTLLSKDAIEETRKAGELILGNLKKIKKGMHAIELIDPYSNRTVEIALDPKKSAPQNAQAYFARYKKLKRGQPRLREKIAALEKSLLDVKTAPAGIKPGPRRAGTTPAVSRPFRQFVLASGAIVYVGKNARSNDELTFGFARPHDYFFHVRGYEGSHVILRTKVPKTQKPPKQDLIAAASIAAYFSKAKTQKNVPVSYTQRKYVKKDRKGKPGAAIMMREQVMFVDPELPKETRDAEDTLR